MPEAVPRAAPVRADDSGLPRVLEAYIETLKAENESLKRQLAAAEKRVARETAKAEWAIGEFSALARRLAARAAVRASRGGGDSKAERSSAPARALGDLRASFAEAGTPA